MKEIIEKRIPFTKEMKKTHTLLVPTMLSMHFSIIVNILRAYGYKAELLTNSGRNLISAGLKYVHNDTCYPAQLVIGQFLDAINSGKYDVHRIALVIMQTGGGCRASNYIYLLRKALRRAGYGYIPVLSVNLSGIEKNSGFKITIPMWHRMVYAAFYGDLLLTLKNQTLPYEINKGDTDALIDKWISRLAEEMSHKLLRYKKIKKNYAEIVKDFAAIPKNTTPKPKVGIVGEIYVKFSPIGNNNLEDFLLSEGAEPVVPGLVDFCLYTIKNADIDYKLYGRGGYLKVFLHNIAYRFLIKKQNDLINTIKENSDFRPMTSFDEVPDMRKGIINLGVKMGEGWLLTAEMIELIHSGVNNIVCTQPFGCLPNHIVGKGMMKPIREKYPNANIIAIDYDAGASKINQENRLKLMLFNARENMGREIEDVSKPVRNRIK